MWQELGIARTKDAKAIRRAYAVRLRTIDPDTDPAAFRRLRAAYEIAIAYSARPEPVRRVAAVADVVPQPSTQDFADDVFIDDDECVIDEADRPPPPRPREPTEEERDSDRIRQEIAAALEAGQSRAAIDLFTSALARGYVGIGEREHALGWIMPAVMADRTLSAPVYLATLHDVGWDVLPRAGEWLSPTRKAAMARGEAERWFLNLEESERAVRQKWSTAAIQNPASWTLRKQRAKAARLLLRGGVFIGTGAAISKMLEAHVKFYEHHSSWIARYFAPGRVARVQAFLRRRQTLRPFRQVGYIVGGVVLIVLAVGLAVVMGNVGPLIGAVFLARLLYALSKRV